MAIDMIENNELGAFREGRLGWSQFIDDKYKNYTGAEDFYNLFGSRKEKKTNIRQEVRAKYADLPTDCDNIAKSIEIINTDLQTLLKQKQNVQQRERQDETNIILGEYKKLAIRQDCESKKAAATKEAEREATLSTLTKLTETSVGKAQEELTGLQAAVAGTGDTAKDANKKLLIYGGVGIAALVIIALILKK